MRSANLAFVLAQAAHDDHRGEPFAQAVAGAVEVGVVVPSILRANLEKAGFSVVSDTAALAEYGFATLATLKRVVIRDKAGVIVAMGAAGDHDEAILHAVLGWFREHPAGDGEVPAGILEAPTQPEAIG